MDYFNYTDNNYVKVWTAGATLDGGTRTHAGTGVFFGNPNKWNDWRPIIGKVKNDYHAEIQAVTEACNQAFDAQIPRLRIITDSNFVLNFWFNFMDNNNYGSWTIAIEAPIVNKTELLEMEHVVKRMGTANVQWRHFSEEEDTVGIELANALARKGADEYRETNHDYGEYTSESDSGDEIDDFIMTDDDYDDDITDY